MVRYTMRAKLAPGIASKFGNLKNQMAESRCAAAREGQCPLSGLKADIVWRCCDVR